MVEAMISGFPAVPAPEFVDPLPGYSYVGEQCIAASYRVPDELKRRVNGAVRYAGDTGKIPGVESQTDLVRVAAHSYVAQLEQEFNNGQTFPDPGANNHRGRQPITRVSGSRSESGYRCHCTGESWGPHDSSTTPARYPESPARTDSSPRHLTPSSSNWSETTTTAGHFMTLAGTCPKDGYRPVDQPQIAEIPGPADLECPLGACSSWALMPFCEP